MFAFLEKTMLFQPIRVHVVSELYYKNGQDENVGPFEINHGFSSKQSARCFRTVL